MNPSRYVAKRYTREAGSVRRKRLIDNKDVFVILVCKGLAENVVTGISFAGAWCEVVSEMAGPLPRIMIVDDDEESRYLLQEVLEANGYTVQALENGMAAREALSLDGSYRIIIADLRMPKESGLELLRYVRKQNSAHGIILMSSFISGIEREVAEELGVYAVLEKPFRLSDLIQKVAELAAKAPVRIATPEAGNSNHQFGK